MAAASLRPVLSRSDWKRYVEDHERDLPSDAHSEPECFQDHDRRSGHRADPGPGRGEDRHRTARIRTSRIRTSSWNGTDFWLGHGSTVSQVMPDGSVGTSFTVPEPIAGMGWDDPNIRVLSSDRRVRAYSTLGVLQSGTPRFPSAASSLRGLAIADNLLWGVDRTGTSDRVYVINESGVRQSNR